MARCTGHSSQTGNQCRNQSIPGGFVCRFHGGAAPQVKQKAKERLAALADPAIDVLHKHLSSNNERTRQSAADSILDRAGYKGIDKIQEIPYQPEELEALENLSDDELTQYIALRRKVTQPRSSTGTPAAPGPK